MDITFTVRKIPLPSHLADNDNVGVGYGYVLNVFGRI
jgi:hypothetical protein